MQQALDTLLSIIELLVSDRGPQYAILVVLILERERLMCERAEAQKQAQLAATQERERVARELHDSISQAFFAISLEAQRAEDRQEMDQEQWRNILEQIIVLTEMGQAEMRTLLFELRPESLEREGLIGALLKEVTILRTRYGLVVETELGEEPALSLEGKHAFYRIAQEAFHNVVKHAYASRVNLRLVSREREVVLVIQDDGRGFDPSASFPGHLGLRSIQERIAPLQGEVLIESSPGRGTTLTISV
jgi:signal transduction histidine kinase